MSNHQIGGTHYDMAISPLEFIEKNNIPFSEGNVIKYMCRHSRKNGAEDVRKAISYCEDILKYRYGIDPHPETPPNLPQGEELEDTKINAGKQMANAAG